MKISCSFRCSIGCRYPSMLRISQSASHNGREALVVSDPVSEALKPGAELLGAGDRSEGDPDSLRPPGGARVEFARGEKAYPVQESQVLEAVAVDGGRFSQKNRL